MQKPQEILGFFTFACYLIRYSDLTLENSFPQVYEITGYSGTNHCYLLTYV
jgi:hypothetical protein